MLIGSSKGGMIQPVCEAPVTYSWRWERAELENTSAADPEYPELNPVKPGRYRKSEHHPTARRYEIPILPTCLVQG